MLRVGLTGGIGCGKSTVAAMLRELGCLILEADLLAHRLMEPGQPAYIEIVRDFGRQILAADERIDRPKLAEVVFRDLTWLTRLNQIVHPRVLDALDRQLEDLARKQPHAVAIVEAALLVESRYHERLDRLVVVWCRPEQQIERLIARGMERSDADRRIASQMPLEEKRRLADDEIDNSETPEHTRQQVDALVEKFRRMAGAAVA
jgi:dephospho-CoA kinase